MNNARKPIPILPLSFNAEEPVMPLGSVKLSDELEQILIAGTSAEGCAWTIAPATMLKSAEGPNQIITFGVFPRDAAAPQPAPIERDGTNQMHSLDDLPLTDDYKALVLEWFARKLWVMLQEGSEDPDYHHKSYDPLVIDLEEKEAHSYVFNLGDGGRHHPFGSLTELEERLEQEGISRIKELRQ